jgi:hypothetical protein
VRNLLRKRRLIAVGATVIALGVAALVYAAWLAGGTGSGYAKAKSAQQLTTVDVSASTSATLYPGADGDVLIKISNPNPYPVRVTGVAGNGAITADSGHSSCSTTGVTYTNQSGLTIDVAAGSSTQATLSNAAHMSNSSDDGCQGAVFTIPVSLTGQSNAP